jgi:hypothetical protein
MQKQSRKSRPWLCVRGEAAKRARLQEWRRALMAPEPTFSIRAIQAELDAPKARIPDGDS